MNLDKSINNIAIRLKTIENQETVKDEKDPELIAKQRYEKYKEHWYFHKSSWSLRGLNAYDGKGCNQIPGCVSECKFYAKEGKLRESEGFD